MVEQVVVGRRLVAVAQLDHRDRHRARAARRRRPTTAAPRHRGMAFERGAHVVGLHLEAAADDGLVGAAHDPEEAVGVERGPGRWCGSSRVVAELRGPHLEQARLVGAERRAPSSRVDDAQLAARRGRGRRCPAWPPRTRGGRRGSSPRRRRRTRWRAYDVSTGTPYFAVNASASSGSSGAVPDMTERMLREIVAGRGRRRAPCAARWARGSRSWAGGGARRRPTRRR